MAEGNRTSYRRWMLCSRKTDASSRPHLTLVVPQLACLPHNEYTSRGALPRIAVSRLPARETGQLVPTVSHGAIVLSKMEMIPHRCLVFLRDRERGVW